jgi:hypothetical protein
MSFGCVAVLETGTGLVLKTICLKAWSEGPPLTPFLFEAAPLIILWSGEWS